MAIAEGGLARDLGRWLMNTIIAAICQKSMDCRLLPVPEPSPNGAALALLWAKSPTQAPRVEDQLGNFPSSGAPRRGTRDFRLAEKTLRMMAQSRANQRRPPREAKVRPAAASSLILGAKRGTWRALPWNAAHGGHQTGLRSSQQAFPGQSGKSSVDAPPDPGRAGSPFERGRNSPTRYPRGTT